MKIKFEIFKKKKKNLNDTNSVYQRLEVCNAKLSRRRNKCIQKKKAKSLLSQVLTAREADEEWGMAIGTVRRDCNRGRFYAEEVKKSAGTWLITRQALARVYGEPNKNKQ
jgi:hypothetical protein